MELIEVNNLKKVFKQGDINVEALRGVTFQVMEGEFSALVGPSGSGKTTMLNIIGALDYASDGNVSVDGINLNDLKNKQLSEFRLQKIGFVFQAYNLIPVLTVLENVEYVLTLKNVPKKERLKRCHDILKEMGLEELSERFPKQLSGGQQQRVAVARALISDPKVVLADEPTANLDSKNADVLLDIMQEMCKSKKTTFLFSTHDERVMKRAGRLIKLRDGNIENPNVR
ncbi:MAG: ABC transporter ATP-binding protein [Leptospiraceae bacterium]|nr:ABC transporter ATP-binding protein [Leptospiraceae bacterium]